MLSSLKSKYSSNKSLFLICPTDHMEERIEHDFRGEAFYFNALGVYFDFGIETQLNLRKVIRRNNINQIIFITSLDNIFYKKVFEDTLKSISPLVDALDETRKKVNNYDIESNWFSSSFQLFVSQHLKNQINRLLKTDYLGTEIREQGITLRAFIYQPIQRSFCSLNSIDINGNLLNQISYN